MGNEQDLTIGEDGSGDSEATEFIGPESQLTEIGDSDHAPTRDDVARDRGPEAPASAGFGRFRDLEFLAEGGMGQVLTATDPEIGRRVAIKVLRPEIESDRIRLEKFRNEARITGLLEHPNIIPVHEAGQSPDGRVYFSMKLVQGESLAGLLGRERERTLERGLPLDPTPFLEHLIKACDALSFAHHRGVVHRDLKPENLMVGRFGEVLVMDWGLARSIRTDEETGVRLDEATGHDPLRTLDGTIQGTPAYMPPEQALGEVSEVDEQSDVYALGAILYDIVAGTPPQVGPTTKEILRRITRGDLERPRDRAPEANIPAELEAVVLKAMAFEKRDRYPDARAFQADIQAYLEGRVLEAASYNPLQLFSKWVSRNRKMCTGAAAVCLVSLTLFGVSRWREGRERDDTFEGALTDARALLGGLKDLAALTEPRPVVDEKTGAEYRESPEERGRREKAIQTHLEAIRHLGKALQIHPENESVRRQRIEVGKALGALALVGRDYLLARSAYERLVDFGLPSNERARFLERIEQHRTARLTWRGNRLRFILVDLTRGLSHEQRPVGAPLLPDYVFEAVGYRDPQTVKILGEDLTKLIEKAEKEGKKVTWTQPERDRGKFICRVLGRLGLAACVKPLGGWMKVIRDHELAVEVGLALCNTRNPEAQSYLVEARDDLGVSSESWRQIQECFNRIPDSESEETLSSAADYRFRARSYRQKKKYDKAIEYYTRAIEFDPIGESRRSFDYNGRGLARRDKGDLQGAIEDFNRAIELDPKYSAFYSNRALARNANGDLKGAIKDYTRAIEIEPGDYFAYNNRGVLRQEKRDLPGAIEDYSKAIELDPKYVGAYSNRGLARRAKGDLEGAIEDFDQAIETDPRFAMAYCNRGIVRKAKRDLDGAIEDFDQAIEIDPRYAKAYNGRGAARKEKGDLEGAIGDYSQAIELDPKLAAAYINRGNLRESKGDLRGAIEDHSKAIELKPNHALAYGNRGRARKAKGDLDGAIEDFNKAIELDPKNARYYNNRGLWWQAKGNLNGAIEDYTRAIEIDPKLVEPYINRGRAWSAKGDQEGAIEDYNKAIQLVPNLAMAYNNRGFARYSKGDLQGAIEDYSRAIEINPRYSDAYVNRGATRYSQGNLRAAIADYEKALEVAAENWRYRKKVEKGLAQFRKKLAGK